MTRPTPNTDAPAGATPAPAAVRAAAAAVALAALLGTAAAPAAAADLTVVVRNVKSADGPLMVAVYGREADYPDRALRALQTAATVPETRIRFTDLPEGAYAVRMFHDRNGNGQLDANLLGIPREPYGFSGRPAAQVGPPGWNDARIDLPAGGGETVVTLSD